MTEEERLRRLAEKQAAKRPMELVEFNFTDEQRKEMQDDIKRFNLPF